MVLYRPCSIVTELRPHSPTDLCPPSHTRTLSQSAQSVAIFLRRSSFVLRPSSFVVRPSSFVLRRSSFVLRPSSFVLRRSSFVLRPSSLLSSVKEETSHCCSCPLFVSHRSSLQHCRSPSVTFVLNIVAVSVITILAVVTAVSVVSSYSK